MRLTKRVVQLLLEQNDGFERTTQFSGNNFREHRRYRISDGKLQLRSTGKTSWAVGRFDSSFVADDDQTRRFLRKFLDALNTNGVEQSAIAVRETLLAGGPLLIRFTEHRRRTSHSAGSRTSDLSGCSVRADLGGRATKRFSYGAAAADGGGACANISPSLRGCCRLPTPEDGP